MAIKERLLKQLNKVRDGLHAMPPFISRDLRALHDALAQARDLCSWELCLFSQEKAVCSHFICNVVM